MQTSFSLAQLADPDIREAEQILRKCVHCGFCTATCPTYVLRGDELDSPRGRIYLLKDMLENDRPANPLVARHLDRCLSCLSCMTTCPSGVDYMHLVDLGRERIERTLRRPPGERALRWWLKWMLPVPWRFRLGLAGAVLARPVARWLAPLLGDRLRAMLALAPARIPPPSPVDRPGRFPAEGRRIMRVALLNGCAQQVLVPRINEATVRLLTRLGVEVVVARGAGCCGALAHHLGDAARARAAARANVAAWTRELEGEGLDAVVINASGCGTTVKDYGHLLRGDPDHAGPAARLAGLAVDVSELLDRLGLAPHLGRTGAGGIVAYHAACSLQHGQKVTDAPKRLLRQAGFTVAEVPESHLCCGSAGTYNLLQPALAGELRDRKLRNLESTGAAMVAAGNIGCMTQLAGGTAMPLLHTVELLDWATGGPRPAGLDPPA